MKQDWDLIRKILLKIEGLPKAGAINSKEFANEWIDSDTVAYTIIFLFESELVDGIFKRGTSGSLWCEVARLTSEGSQFLDAIKQDAVWALIKERAKERNLELSIQVITTM